MRYRQETRADNSDVLIVAGDVADDPEVLIDCLASLREAYGGGVVFVPGNHDLWQTGSLMRLLMLQWWRSPLISVLAFKTSRVPSRQTFKTI